ncbi:MAG: RnfABCDGE type electron transport complex subunit B [Caldimonas sp.]
MAEPRALADRLHDALPQTQCRRCGYDDCRAYAEAIADGRAELNRCPPGGAGGIERLARVVGRPPSPLDPDCGIESVRSVAVVDEAACIGCALCLKACPVDAIVGAARQMHTVIDAACTGCELCIPVCPVDCISLVATSGAATGWDAWSQAQADASRRRYEARRRRDAKQTNAAQAGPVAASAAAKRQAVAATVARARGARAGV